MNGWTNIYKSTKVVGKEIKEFASYMFMYVSYVYFGKKGGRQLQLSGMLTMTFFMELGL